MDGERERNIKIVILLDLMRKGGCIDDWTLEPRSPICVFANAHTNLRKQTIKLDYFLIGPICLPALCMFTIGHTLKHTYTLCPFLCPLAPTNTHRAQTERLEVPNASKNWLG